MINKQELQNLANFLLREKYNEKELNENKELRQEIHQAYDAIIKQEKENITTT